MKRIVDDGFVLGAAMIVRNRVADACSLGLQREGNDGRGATASGRNTAALKIIGTYRAVARGLIEMAMGVDAPRQDVVPAGVDFVTATSKRTANGDDSTVSNAQIRYEYVGCGCEGAAAYH